MTSLSIPPTDVPEVSVVMVLYGHAELALTALRSVVEHTDRPFEAVVLDNASPDAAGEVVAAHVEGLRYVSSPENLGFGQGMNRAVAEARAPSLCLLNSDVVVGPGWLDALLDPLDDPRVGAVVPKYVFPDGRLQEAGSALGSDGVTWAIGGYQTEGLPPFDVGFPRWVDYGSAACMTLRRADFDVIGGFDPVYGIGYFEDVEFCMELVKRGLRVRYEPGCEIVHELGASSQDLAPQLSHENRETFVERWPGVLDGRPPLADVGKNVHRVVHARDWVTPLRTLVLGSPDDALGRAFVEAARPWTLDVRVTVAGPASNADELRGRGVEVIDAPDREWFRSRLGHASAVVLRHAAHAVDVEETQPLAATIVDLSGGRSTSGFEPVLLHAAAVVVDTQAQADEVRALAPDAHMLSTDAREPAAVAAEALARAGVAAPVG